MRIREQFRLPLSRTRHFGAAMSAIALVQAAPALAQETATVAPDNVEAAPGDQIIVTGSRVARDGFQAPTPLTVLSETEIDGGSPTNNIADFVNTLPALAGSTRPSNSRLNISSGQAGINALNLRNLGAERTLILVNGRRSVGSTITGLVDINTIPQALISSVEVVSGGASAAYGSDAVAGVVNFVLNNKYEGLKVEADSGITQEGDGFNYSANIAAGMAFADGRGHVLLSGEVAHRDGIFDVNRDWNATGFVRITNPDYTTTNGQPQFLIRRQVGAANSAPGSLITGSAGGTANRLRGLYFTENGAINQFIYGPLTFPSPTGSSPPTLTQGGSWQVNDSGRRIGLDPEDDRYGVFGRVSFEISDGIELFAEGAYNQQKVRFNAGPNLQTGILLNATGCTQTPVPITCNAFLLNALGADRLQGITSVTIATTSADLPGRGIDNKRKVQRYLIGAQGDFDAFGKTARWDIFGQYSRAELREQLRDIQNIARINAARDAAFAPAGSGFPAGSIQCLINVDADPLNNDSACVPLNRLGLGVADPAAIDYVLGDPYRDQVIEQTVIGANFSATPFATWAGDVSVAIGAEYRKEEVKGFVPEEFQPLQLTDANGNVTGARNLWSVGNYLPSFGSYDVKEAYLETVIPLGFGLEFNGAVRATDYSTAGYVTTWKAGATWQPIDDIRLRVTRSRDIRAPNLNDLFQAGTANSDSVSNPGFVNGTSPSFVPAGQPAQSGYAYSGFATGNTALGPEKADQWNVGAVFTPTFLPGFNLAVDYFDIEVNSGISTFSAQQIVNLCFLGEAAFCDAITTDPTRTQEPARPYLIIRTQPFNAASQKVRGIDMDASYRMPLGNGAVTLRGIATRYLENRFDSGVPNTVVIDTTGVNGGQSSTPKWIYRVSASYDSEDFGITAIGRGVSSGKYVANGIECQTGCPTSTVNAPTYESNSIDGAFYVDLNLTQKFSGSGDTQGEFFINVSNLFNADPILLPETGLAANSTYSDLLGRSFRVGVRFKLK
ncbi:TonB-dependent receptor plug domain-containing protein [Sphingopyxis sp. RIFCSPHIGHO2_12_FULL_65_19]|uniref:TonB-dependent receptor plug domain-containing protein n=1 Tax=Sphingopyxis sp. RIFCSPHIGHO2_12_FULL_65_19 TaxID=1802172 RepID=UPI000A5C9687|nr:TonB-dependent receptor [Sphingopyxis sp. RIFCSPHIGHO2_12_FULL_65_19]